MKNLSFSEDEREKKSRYEQKNGDEILSWL